MSDFELIMENREDIADLRQRVKLLEIKVFLENQNRSVRSGKNKPIPQEIRSVLNEIGVKTL